MVLKSHTDLSLVFENGSTSPLGYRGIVFGVDHVVVCQHALVVSVPAKPPAVAGGEILHTVGILSCPSNRTRH